MSSGNSLAVGPIPTSVMATRLLEPPLAPRPSHTGTRRNVTLTKAGLGSSLKDQKNLRAPFQLFSPGYIMRPEAFDSVRISKPAGHARLVLRQHSPLVSSLLRLSVLASIAVAVLLPQLAMLAAALSNPEARATAALHPFSSLALALALALSLLACLWPLARGIERFNARRAVLIGRRTVRAGDVQFGRLSRWQEPISAYVGLAHRVRTSLSGARHELFLVHPSPARSVLLETREHISDSDIAQLSHLLGVPLLQPAVLNTPAPGRPVNEKPANPPRMPAEAIAA